jgi:hypothetical protein
VVAIAPAMPWTADEEDSAIPADWVEIDEDLIAAIPSQPASGYTELLRQIDSEEVPSFVEPEATVDPYATPDTAGDPIDFEDLLSVTSRDGTAPLGPVGHEGASVPMAPTIGEETGWPAAATVAAPGVGPAGAVEVDLGEIEPFRFDEADVGGVVDDPLAADFSEFDDGAGVLPVAAAVAAVAPVPMVDAIDLPVPAPIDDPIKTAPAPQVAEAPVFGVVPDAAAAATLAAAEAKSGLTWPTFVGDVSDRIDREGAAEGLFARLRSDKQALVAAGTLAVDRSLLVTVGRAPAVVGDGFGATATVTAARPVLTTIDGDRATRRVEGDRLDLTELRVRLIESEEAASEIAAVLETAIGQGYPDPLALRVLGEAYLRLGRTEQAAAQFRQAMLARRRAR